MREGVNWGEVAQNGLRSRSEVDNETTGDILRVENEVMRGYQITTRRTCL